MPQAWQARGVATGGGSLHYGDDPRSFADMIKDPVRWCFSNAVKAATTMGILSAGLLYLVF